MSERGSLSIKYVGPELHEKPLGIEDFAPALLSLNSFVKETYVEAGKISRNEQREARLETRFLRDGVSIGVTQVRQGSYEFVVLIESAVGAFSDLFQSVNLPTPSHVVETVIDAVISEITSSIFGGIFKGKNSKSPAIAPGPQEDALVKKIVTQLDEKGDCVEWFDQILSPLLKDGIDYLEIRLSQGGTIVFDSGTASTVHKLAKSPKPAAPYIVKVNALILSAGVTTPIWKLRTLELGEIQAEMYDSNFESLVQQSGKHLQGNKIMDIRVIPLPSKRGIAKEAYEVIRVY